MDNSRYSPVSADALGCYYIPVGLQVENGWLKMDEVHMTQTIPLPLSIVTANLLIYEYSKRQTMSTHA